MNMQMAELALTAMHNAAPAFAKAPPCVQVAWSDFQADVSEVLAAADQHAKDLEAANLNEQRGLIPSAGADWLRRNATTEAHGHGSMTRRAAWLRPSTL